MNIMRKPIIAGNWKMNKNNVEAIDLVTFLKRDLNDVNDVDIIVCPPFTALSDVKDVLMDSNIMLGAQNLHWEEAGAFTGEVSAPIIKEAGAQFVIIGHSERRQFFGETNESVNKKIKAALKWNLVPIVCVGENLQEREKNRTFDVVRDHCEGAFNGFSEEEVEKMIIAYEPVWAIGTGKTATPQQAQEVHKFIRELLTRMYNEELAAGVRIQYGGSVKPENIAELMAQSDIDGALVGGASLSHESFVKIVKNSCGLGLKKGF